MTSVSKDSIGFRRPILQRIVHSCSKSFSDACLRYFIVELRFECSCLALFVFPKQARGDIRGVGVVSRFLAGVHAASEAGSLR